MKTLTIALILVISPLSPCADEGMWTFDNPPLKQWKERYGFEPPPGWLDHVRLASVRLNGGGSGSFVSPDGLVMTNQHVGRSQVQKLSTPQRDLIKHGFYAASREDELPCPDLEVNVLVSYEDVSQRVHGAVQPGASDKDANAQRKAEMAAIEKESAEKTGLRSEVVTLYSGGEYWLYRFKKYTDVRLVFVPEEQIAYFGGDYDNFTYPRYCLDITFFRVYEGGRAARTDHYFKWSQNGPSEGELVVISGYPGSTNRLMTLAQLKYHRDVGNPLQMQVWTSRHDALVRFAALGTEQARRASAARLSLSNSIKRLVGQQAGLMNPRILGKKEEEEKALRSEVERRPELKRDFGSAWDQIAAAYATLPDKAPRIAFSDLAPSRLGSIALNVVRYVEEIRKPNEKRYEEFRDSKLDSFKFGLLSPAPIYKDLEEAVLTAWLEQGSKILGLQDPFVRAALEGKSPAETAKWAVGGTRLTDVAARKALLEGGVEAVARSDDPMIVLARRVDPIMRELRAWREENIQSIEIGAGEKLANARFAVYGKTIYPDATSSLRLGYGTVSSYEEGTTLVPFRTTFYGLYDRAASFSEKAPFNLPQRYKDKQADFNLATPLNFVYTADTIGGNSGSPVINRAAEIVGINFDSNLQKLPNRYLYIEESEGSRAIAVHSAAIIEVLKKIYGAAKLVSELTEQ